MEEAFDCWDAGKNPDDYHQFFDECVSWNRTEAPRQLASDEKPTSVAFELEGLCGPKAATRLVSLV